MKKALQALLVGCGLIIAIFVLPLFIGIWLPDVFFAPQNTLAEQHLASGHSFRVIQYWNHCDFYNTELFHVFPDGTAVTNILDGDDNKSWSVPLTIDEKQKIVSVTLSGGRLKTVNW